MTTIKEIMRTLTDYPLHQRRGRCAACGARLPRRRTAGRCERCGVSRLTNADRELMKLIRRVRHCSEELVRMLQRIKQHDEETLAWIDGQLEFLSGLIELQVPNLDLETLVARGYVPEGKILELYSAAHARTRLSREAAATSTGR